MSGRSRDRGRGARDAGPRAQGFPPVVGVTPKVLVLGSMPGLASLDAGAYYAHPRNAFWALAADVTGVRADAPYDARLAGLVAWGIALWDVVHSCAREGSLDASIDDGSVVPNDVAALLAEAPTITRVCLNGGKAASLFRRHVAPRLAGASRGPRALDVRVLPSTSPAHAARSLDEKRALWVPALRA